MLAQPEAINTSGSLQSLHSKPGKDALEGCSLPPQSLSYSYLRASSFHGPEVASSIPKKTCSHQDYELLFKSSQHSSFTGYIYSKLAALYFRFHDEWIVPILLDNQRRNVFLFGLVNLVFTLFEIVTGYMAGSLSLVGDGFHMLLDAIVIFCNLFISVISLWPPSPSFPYGYGRVEVITGLVNALLLLFVSFSVAVQALERWIYPSDIRTGSVMSVAFIGLLVNLFGLLAFDGATHSHCHSGHNSTDHQHRNTSCSHEHAAQHHLTHHTQHASSKPNMIFQGMFLHILADTLGSVAVIVSTVLIDKTGWLWIDPLCSLFLSAMIATAVYPLLTTSLADLMIYLPEQQQNSVALLEESIKNIPGIVSIEEFKFWLLFGNKYVVTIRCKTGKAVEKSLHSTIVDLLSPWDIYSLTIELDPSTSTS